jgi:hypothetical protein
MRHISHALAELLDQLHPTPMEKDQPETGLALSPWDNPQPTEATDRTPPEHPND